MERYHAAERMVGGQQVFIDRRARLHLRLMDDECAGVLKGGNTGVIRVEGASDQMDVTSSPCPRMEEETYA
ncbi:MAG: hypothetical protein ACYTAN_09550 [Planctomycetota bacterium]